MKRIIYPILLATTALTQSCDNFLDNKPKGFTIPENFEDYSKLLVSQSLAQSMSLDAFYLTDDIHLADDTCSYADISFVNQDDHQRNLYSFKSGQIYTPGSHDYLWNNSYARIYTYNTVINNVLESKGSNDKEKQRLRAEALFHRAFDFLNLVNIYGNHYDAATANTDFGIPLIQTENIVQKYHRNTVAEVYGLIENDLKEAANYLAPTTPNLFHPNAASVNSFFARLYLYMGRYQEALEYANKALDVKSDLHDLKDYIILDKKTWGRLVKEDGSQFLDKDLNPEAIYVRLQSGRKTLAVNKDLIKVFETDLTKGAVDQRHHLFYAKDTVNMGSISYFYGETCFILYADQNVGFSTVENYLIAAECEARIGSKEKAMEHINKLREARIKGNSKLTATSQEDALDKVLAERRREFAFVGFHRLIDLKRLNREDRFKKTLVNSVDGNTYTLEPNDPRYIFPINQLILNYNPDMPQYNR